MDNSNIEKDEYIVQIDKLTKIYPLYNQPRDRFKEALHPFRKKYHHDFYALHDVSFNVTQGEAIGIVGKNGAGKSTLLKILAGVLTPSSGVFKISGKIFSLLELGTGFNPDVTGIENIYFNGMLLGLSKEQMDAKLAQIIAFADIGEFINQPVRNYSSGMAMRLAIAIATTVEPQILLIDESFAVGDMFFRVKCVSRLKEMMATGLTLILVGHDFGMLNSFCKRGILLHEGKLLFDGPIRHALDAYVGLTANGESPRLSAKESLQDGFFWQKYKSNIPENLEGRSGNRKAEILLLQLLDDQGENCKQFLYGQNATCVLRVRVNEKVSRFAFVVFVRDQNGYDIACFDSFSRGSSGVTEELQPGEVCSFQFSFVVSLNGGTYSLIGVVGDPAYSDLNNQSHMVYDFIPISACFEVGVREGFPLLSATEILVENFCCKKEC